MEEKNKKYLAKIIDEKRKIFKINIPKCGYCDEELDSLDEYDILAHQRVCPVLQAGEE